MANGVIDRRAFIRKSTGVGVAASTLLAGCTGSDGETEADSGGDTETADGGDTTTVEFETIEGNLNIMLFEAGMDQGFWEDEGIELDLEQVPFGRYTESMTTGGNDIGIMGYPIFSQYNNEGEDFVHFGPCITQINSILSPVGSDISSAEDLIGARLGHPGWETATATLMRGLVADQFGIDIREDTDDTQADPATLWSLMVDQDDIDAMIQFTGQTVRGLATPDEVQPVFNAWEGWEEQTGYPPLITPLTAERSFLDENPETVLGVLEGWGAAQEYFLENTEEVVEQYGILAGLDDEANQETIIELAQNGDMTMPIEQYTQDAIDSQWELLEVLEGLDLIPSVPPKEDHSISIDELRDMAE